MKTAAWVEDKARADVHMPTLLKWAAAELGRRLVSMNLAELEDDQKFATDAWAQFEGNLRVAARIRIDENRRDWTIRFSRPTGAETEWRKLLGGWGDYYAYAWAAGSSLSFAVLLDLHIARQVGVISPYPNRNWRRYENKDRTAFVAHPVDGLNRYWPRIPCPDCGEFAFSRGEGGDEWRKCHRCGRQWNAGPASVARVIVARGIPEATP